MYAKQENNQIKKFHTLPEYYKNHIGFDKLPQATHQAEGFYPLVIPAGFNNKIQTLGAVFFDEVNQVYTYQVNNIVITLEDAKTKKLKELRDAVRSLYNSLQWVLEMYRNNDQTPPAAIKTKAQDIRTKYQQFKDIINAQETPEDVLNLEIPYDQIKNIQDQIDEIF